MPEYRALAEAETWSAANVVASVILLVVVVAALVWLIRRYLAD
jgi:heme/copper-type cytochrome/quinol oxidase subunit 4